MCYKAIIIFESYSNILELRLNRLRSTIRLGILCRSEIYKKHDQTYREKRRRWNIPLFHSAIKWNLFREFPTRYFVSMHIYKIWWLCSKQRQRSRYFMCPNGGSSILSTLPIFLSLSQTKQPTLVNDSVYRNDKQKIETCHVIV